MIKKQRATAKDKALAEQAKQLCQNAFVHKKSEEEIIEEKKSLGIMKCVNGAGKRCEICFNHGNAKGSGRRCRIHCISTEKDDYCGEYKVYPRYMPPVSGGRFTGK